MELDMVVGDFGFTITVTQQSGNLDVGVYVLQ